MAQHRVAEHAGGWQSMQGGGTCTAATMSTFGKGKQLKHLVARFPHFIQSAAHPQSADQAEVRSCIGRPMLELRPNMISW